MRPFVRSIIVASIIVTCFGSTRAEDAPATAPTSVPARGAYTRHEYLKSALDLNRRTMVEAYKQVGNRSAKWDADAIKFLDGAALRFTNELVSSPMYAIPGPSDALTLMMVGESARSKGCDDPLVAYCYAAVLHEAGRDAEARPLMFKAIDALMNSKYPALRRQRAATFQFQWTDPDAPKFDAAWKRLRDTTLEMFTFDFREIDRRIFYDLARGDFGNLQLDYWAELMDKARAIKDADPWLLAMFEGDRQVQEAWAARGDGTADTVSKEGWQRFFDHLKKARVAYLEAQRLHPEYPEAASRMITVAMGGGDELKEDPRAWFDRATAVQIDFGPAYHDYLYAILPRWGGSVQMMYDFGVECLNTRRFDTDVPFKFATVLDEVASDEGSPQIYRRPGVYEKVREMCEAYRKTDKSLKMKDYYPSYEAAIAWRSGHYEYAAKVLDELGDHIDLEPWRAQRVVPKLAMSHAYAMVTEAKAILEAESKASSKQTDGAIAAYQSLVQKHAAASDRAGDFMKSRLKQLEWEKQYNTGDWVDVQPSAELTGWGELAGSWKVDKDGSLIVSNDPSDPKGSMLVFEGVFLGKGFEMEFSLAMPDAKTPASAGVYFARGEPYGATGFYLTTGGKEPIVYNQLEQSRSPGFTLKPTNVVRLEVCEDLLHLHVDDDLPIHYHGLADYFASPKLYLGLAARTPADTPPLKFSKIRIRKIQELPD